MQGGGSNLTKRYTDPKVVAARVKGLMLEKKWKQTDLAEASGLSLSTIKQYTAGRRVPEKENLSRLAKALQVDEDYLTGASPYRNIWEAYDAKLGDKGLADLRNDVKKTRQFFNQFDFSEYVISNFGDSDLVNLPEKKTHQMIAEIENFISYTVEKYLKKKG